MHGKNLVYARVEADIPNVVTKMVNDFKYNIEEIIDIKELVVGQLVNAPAPVSYTLRTPPMIYSVVSLTHPENL